MSAAATPLARCVGNREQHRIVGRHHIVEVPAHLPRADVDRVLHSIRGMAGNLR